MSIIVNVSDFQSGKFYIPNARDISANNIATQKGEVEKTIDKYERLLLIQALGVTQYTTLKKLIDNNILGDSDNKKWAKLVNGDTYTAQDGKEYIFDGLKSKEGYVSFVAAYIYCNFLRDDDSTYTTAGTVRDTAKNATSVSATPKYIEAWNEFIAGYQGFGTYENTPKIIMNASGDLGLDYFSGTQHFRSLWQYMRDMNDLEADTYDIDQFTVYKQKNSMGI